MRAELEAPENFSFRSTVRSHGWCDLEPFRIDGDCTTLATTVALPNGGAASIRLSADRRGVLLESEGRPDPATRAALETAARRILALDLDLRDFHRRVAPDPDLRWIAEQGVGRMLRAPTAFEDLVKLVLTTNCSWSLTKAMVGNLVARYGERAPDGTRAFPTAARLARLSESEWREKVRAGYRSPSLVKLCRLVRDGDVDPESWARRTADDGALRKEILGLPGVGPYVAENLLKFLGRPDGLALDSWMRARYFEIFHGGRRVTDRTIARRLARLGPWAGLALWFELTRD